MKQLFAAGFIGKQSYEIFYSGAVSTIILGITIRACNSGLLRHFTGDKIMTVSKDKSSDVTPVVFRSLEISGSENRRITTPYKELSQSISISKIEKMKTGKRGLILLPPIQRDIQTNMVTFGGEFSLLALRKFTLFWDCLEVSENNLIGGGGNIAELNFLESCGVVQKTKIEVIGSYGLIEFIKTANLALLEKLSEANPGAWSVASQLNSIAFSDGELSENSGVSFKLYDALIIPDGNVPLEDILEFKHRRNDELLNLRHHLDDVYRKILSSPDRPLTELSEIEKLDKVLSNYNSVTKETGFSFTKSTLQANFSVSRAVAAALVSDKIGLPLSASAMTGVIAGIDVRVGKGLNKSKQLDTPFQYIHSLNREF